VPGDELGQEAEPTDPRAGGATGDFGGDCTCDRTTRELALSEEDEVLGFSAEDVLARIEGEYVLAMVWGDACAGESASEERCTGEPPGFTGSETDVQVAIERAATTARVDECNADLGDHQCHITSLRVSVMGALTTSDGLLDEPFEMELQTERAEDVTVGQRLEADEIGGSLPAQAPGLARIEWSFGVRQTDVWFEVFVVTGTPEGHTRVVSQPVADGRNPAGQSWGVAADLEQARQ
jgi:hypothetical protein